MKITASIAKAHKNNTEIAIHVDMGDWDIDIYIARNYIPSTQALRLVNNICSGMHQIWINKEDGTAFIDMKIKDSFAPTIRWQ